MCCQPEPACFLFDLGNVLLQLADPGKAIARGQKLFSQERLNELWQGSPLVEQFESGECDEEDFVHALIRDFGLSCTGRELLAEFEQYVIAPYPGARDLLVALKKHGQVACLSNTNSLHWRKIDREMNILDCFDHLFPSHWIKCLKPQARAFQTVIEKIQLEPARILFFDDLPDNVMAARNCGMQACQVYGVQDIHEELEARGIIVGG